MREFHVSRLARDRYNFDDSLFRLSGNVIFANFHSARLFAQKINQKRDLVNYPEQAVKAGQINAMGLIDEILHFVVSLYQERYPGTMEHAYDFLESRMGADDLEKVITLFTAQFPSVDVYRGAMSVEEYLQGDVDGVPNRVIALEELLMLWIANQNPAFEPYQELFDDRTLSSDTAYLRLVRDTCDFFENQPSFGPDQQALVEMLRTPAIVVPQSLTGQLEYIREHWSELLGQYLYRLLSSLDLVKEEERLRFLGPGPVPVPIYDRTLLGPEAETERFSEDREWMPRLVVIAKNTYVWLDQLTRKYGYPIRQLGDIPDQELRELAEAGFSGLWLIGLWERSVASARIKQLGGNEEAIASAYSVSNYQIASDLGGEQGYQRLRDKANRFGVRLASDMVPNHMGIDSPWVIEHPDWFISVDQSPFPSYAFTGPDLSPTPSVTIQIEDHYFTRTDAAVVFQRRDNHSGHVQYIYHGNDGTSMPWNDTAQLNYLNPAVREQVIQTILEVARRFPIIRFDAAMTLAKKHYQRLWFPEPGSGGDIPSRAEHALTKAQFDQLLPEEFWREVVDRVAKEAPDTLLLAEAFWMMEGFFVRSLGMHRVYNSAFMNMLRNEDNGNYRQLIKNTLEFDPEILKRYVNFMNNPDERTAVDQFGKGDKYFGVAVLMSTMPGLPMFGHGQIEGYTEKYGMEFKRAYRDETPDAALVERHQKEIFPLLHRRSLFSGVQDFLLYDFFGGNGQVNEDVFAYSNASGGEHSLVVYNNRFSNASGWIRLSAGYIVKGPGDDKHIQQRTLSEGLGLHPAPDRFVVFRDLTANLEFVRSTVEIAEKGMYFDLGAYKYHVFADFREVQDDNYHSYAQLVEYLQGRGVPNVEQAMKELLLTPVLDPFKQIANAGYFHYLMANRRHTADGQIRPELLDEAEQKVRRMVEGIGWLSGYNRNPNQVVSEIRQKLEIVLSLHALEYYRPVPGGQKYQAALDYVRTFIGDDEQHWLTLLAWVFVHNLGKLASSDGYENQTQSWVEEWQFGRQLAQMGIEAGIPQEKAWLLVNNLQLLVGQQNWYQDNLDETPETIVRQWLSQEEIQRFVGINRYKDVLWFNKESFEEFVWWMMIMAMLQSGSEGSLTASQFTEQVLGAHEMVETILAAAEKSNYQVSKLLAGLKE